MLNILMFIVVGLTVVIGLSVLNSTQYQKNRLSSIGFSVAILGSSLWVLFVQLFRNATNMADASVFHLAFAVSAMLMPLGFTIYAISLYNRKALSIISTIITSVIVLIVGFLVLTNSNQFYSEIVLSAGNNYTILIDGPLFLAYGAVFGVFLTISTVLVLAKAVQVRKKQPGLSRGLVCLSVCEGLSSVSCSVFNIGLPALGYYEFFWIGPLAVAIMMLAVYFATLKYKLFVNNSKMLQYSTYLVAVMMGAIVYTVLFHLVFMLIFRGATPSDEIVIFQFIMIIIIILFMPTINHFIEYVKHIITENGVVDKEGKEDAKQIN